MPKLYYNVYLSEKKLFVLQQIVNPIRAERRGAEISIKSRYVEKYLHKSML